MTSYWWHRQPYLVNSCLPPFRTSRVLSHQSEPAPQIVLLVHVVCDKVTFYVVFSINLVIKAIDVMFRDLLLSHLLLINILMQALDQNLHISQYNAL